MRESRTASLIRAYVHRHFPRKLKLVDVSTYALTRFMDWLADEKGAGQAPQRSHHANAVIPIRAALATAKREGLIREEAPALVLGPRPIKTMMPSTIGAEYPWM